MAAISDVRKKWHVQPALSVEFVAYYLDRMTRLRNLKTTLENNIDLNATLLSTQQKIREEYENESKKNLDLKSSNESLQNLVKELHKQIDIICPGKDLPNVEQITQKPVKQQLKEQVQLPAAIPAPARPMSVPTAAALKMGVGFPLQHLSGSTVNDTGRILSTQSKLKNDLLHECGICKHCNDQHLLVKCDTCHFHYHLGCLNPPLTRHPKKSKLYGWQCSECDKSDDSDAPVELAAKRQRKVRKFSKDGSFVILSDSSDSEKRKIERKPEMNGLTSPRPVSSLSLSSRKSAGVKSPSSEVLNLSNKAKSPPVQNHFSALSSHQPAKDKCNNSVKVLVENVTIPTQSSPFNHLNHTFPSASEELNDVSIVGITENGEQNVNGRGRKKRKEKHRNKEYSFESDKSASKEHKRKRKKKNLIDEHGSHEGSAETTTVNPGHKIRVKFKPFPALPGEDAPEPHFFYVSADSVRPDTSRPTSVETVEDSTTLYDDNSARSALSPIMMTMLKENTYRISSSSPNQASYNHVSSSHVSSTNSQNTPARKSPFKSSTPKEKSPPKKPSLPVPKVPVISPSKFIPARRLSRLNSTIPKAIRQMIPKMAAKVLNKSAESSNIKCDVCHLSGTHQNVVMCDECKKNYHFNCLDPPLTKTPKRRGYSWHCAECDPTDTEN